MVDDFLFTRRRPLGRTGLRVSALGFGASPLGNVFGRVEPAEGMRAVHMAIDRGINFFDVSPYYGQTLAESRLGEALEGKRHEVVLATKCGRYGADVFDFSPSSIASGLEASLRRLRTDFVDLLQVHDVEFGDLDRIAGETLPALYHLRQAGKVRHIGITGYPLAALMHVAGVFEPETILSYCHWDLLSRDMDELLTPFAEKRNIGLINGSPMHMGVLTPGGPPAWHPAPALVLEAGRRAAAVCRIRAASLPEMALRFCLRHPYVSSTLVGIANEAQLLENLRALTDSAEADTLIAELETVMSRAMNVNWPSGRGDADAETVSVSATAQNGHEEC